MLSIMDGMPVFDIYDGLNARRVRITARAHPIAATTPDVKSDTTLEVGVIDPPPQPPFPLTGLDDEPVPRIRIGRSSVNDVFLHEPMASRQHCEIRYEVPFDAHNLSTAEECEKIYILHDLQSRNGTWLNSRRVTEPTPLKNGDEIGIGRSAFRFWTSENDIDPNAARLPLAEK